MSPSTDDVAVTADIQQLLEVLSTRVSSDPYAAVREYVSNAYDASKTYVDSKVKVRCEDRCIIIADNGCGMTSHVLRTAFTRIGGHHQAGGARGIGQFGLGVLTAFMIAELLVVETRSDDESVGWRLEWHRGARHFRLLPLNRSERGTTVTMHLAKDHAAMANEAGIRDYVGRVFGLLPMPVLVGRVAQPANMHHDWRRGQQLSEAGQLLTSPDAHEILQRYCQLDLIAAYGAAGPNGSVVLLGIPLREHAPLRRHRVQFFSRGVSVAGGISAFFPENLAFVVGLIDHPDFTLQIARNSLTEGSDPVFSEAHGAIETHILRFLELLAAEAPKVMAEVLGTHGTMLNAHRRRQPRLRELFRNHYCFATSLGPKPWRDLSRLAHSATLAGEHRERVLLVLAEDGDNLQLQTVAGRLGYPVVRAMNGDRDLLEDFGRTDGVEIHDISRLMEEDQADIPESFRALAARLAPELRRHGVNAVTFLSLPGELQRPAELQIGKVNASACPKVGQWLQVKSLMLNVAHPLIERLAAISHRATTEALAEAADTLYAVAALHSPLLEVHREVNRIVIQQLVSYLEQELGHFPKVASVQQAKCFVAMSYRPEYGAVWEGVRSVLSGEPYGWEVARADLDVHTPGLLEGVIDHIGSSRRFIADISGGSPSVLIELGMMIQKDPASTLVLADEKTFQVVPTDLRGTICMVYPSELRGEPGKFKDWFRRELRNRRQFIALWAAKVAC